MSYYILYTIKYRNQISLFSFHNFWLPHFFQDFKFRQALFLMFCCRQEGQSRIPRHCYIGHFHIDKIRNSLSVNTKFKIPNNSQYYKQEKNYSFKTWSFGQHILGQQPSWYYTCGGDYSSLILYKFTNWSYIFSFI